MSFDAAAWPHVERLGVRAPQRRRGVMTVWRWELAKLTHLVRVQALFAVCLLAPFGLAGALAVQGAVPSDTLFGQWVHQSGYALPMVVLSFAGQWGLPLVVALVAGDVFSAEDHFGTWKTLLTRSRTRGELFTGKALAALTHTLLALGLLAGASLAAGLLLGGKPIVGLAGQVVPASQATWLVLASWALQLPPMLGFTSLAILLSITSRNSVVGIGAPVLLGLLFQVLSLVNLPERVRISLLSTGFQSWHGLWVTQRFYGPIWHALVASTAWFAVCGALAWLVFARRSIRVAA